MNRARDSRRRRRPFRSAARGFSQRYSGCEYALDLNRGEPNVLGSSDLQTEAIVILSDLRLHLRELAAVG